MQNSDVVRIQLELDLVAASRWFQEDIRLNDDVIRVFGLDSELGSGEEVKTRVLVVWNMGSEGGAREE